MCGICGLVSLDGASGPDPAALAAMNETLVHRGPDSDGSVIDGPAGLAMRRLSIIEATAMLLARLERKPEIETALHASFERLLARYGETRPISEAMRRR